VKESRVVGAMVIVGGGPWLAAVGSLRLPAAESRGTICKQNLACT